MFYLNLFQDQQPSTSQHSSNVERKRTHDCVKLSSEHMQLSTAKRKKEATVVDESGNDSSSEKRKQKVCSFVSIILTMKIGVGEISIFI